jgi:hypothetical protein
MELNCFRQPTPPADHGYISDPLGGFLSTGVQIIDNQIETMPHQIIYQEQYDQIDTDIRLWRIRVYFDHYIDTFMIQFEPDYETYVNYIEFISVQCIGHDFYDYDGPLFHLDSKSHVCTVSFGPSGKYCKLPTGWSSFTYCLYFSEDMPKHKSIQMKTSCYSIKLHDH